MKRLLKFLLPSLLIVSLVVALVALTQGKSVDILEPAGTIADQQRNLIVIASLLSLVVILPVFALTFFIVWRYRANNHKATYTPEWDGSKILETVWWGIPCIIIAILAVITWTSSHQLDPYRPIASDKKPLTVQVIALQWKWLFIYPEYGIATVNYVQFPEDRPVNFKITADAPMNSFWIPKLGGQVYAMAGMQTELNLMADKPGTYEGSSANLSGAGFAGMRFEAVSSTQESFNSWINQTQASPKILDSDSYAQLAKPSENNVSEYYTIDDQALYDTVMMKFMAPSGSEANQHTKGETGQH